MESQSTGIETSPSDSKQFIFELSEELLHQNKELPTHLSERHYYSSSAHDDHSMSDISESMVSDDDTFSFVDEEDLDLMPCTNHNQENSYTIMRDDCMRGSILTWTSRFSMLEDPQVLHSASIMLTLAR